MGAQSLASSNAYFQGAVRQAESWKRASDKADNALRRQQKKYATLEKKLKRKEEELGESNAELVVLRAEKDKAIDNYLDSEEFAQSMRIRDDSVFPEFFRTGWDTALGTVNEACPDINPADYICPDDEALLQRSLKELLVDVSWENRGFREGPRRSLKLEDGVNFRPNFRFIRGSIARIDFIITFLEARGTIPVSLVVFWVVSWWPEKAPGSGYGCRPPELGEIGEDNGETTI
ncbi:uncharacterized protein LOC141679439 [Apium graveolens]|uniref:uncharacterized protein LOC141679439 n=1 Tax=Apium graveolens TaxID=4045 RepID=UPI003D7AAF6F